MYPFGSTAIAHDVENRHGTRRQKRDSVQTTANMPQASKRAALGTITNQARVQPLRAAKQAAQTEGHFRFIASGDENATARVAGKSFSTIQPTSVPFSIHIDKQHENHKPKQNIELNDTKLQLNSVVTGLARQPLCIADTSSDVITIDDDTDSPMVIEVSSYEEQSSESQSQKDALITCVPEYCQDIYKYLREAELRNRPKPHYMKKQPDVTCNMRSILVDWLVEVAEEYKLHRETLFLAVNYIDRFLSQMSVLRGKLQLVGAASLFLAAKYEEIYPPDVGEFVYITDDTYTKKQVLRMEHLILKVLSFDVAIPTANVFCERYLKLMGADDRVEALTMYLIELTMVESDTYLKYLPSVIAASAVCLAYHTLGNDSWKDNFYQVTAYQPGEIESCIRDLHAMHRNANHHQQQSIQEKYKSTKFHAVASEPTAIALPSCFLQ